MDSLISIVLTKRGITITRVANFLGVSRQAVSLWTKIPDKHVKKLYELFGEEETWRMKKELWESVNGD